MIQDWFDKLDANHDGCISREEWMEGFRSGLVGLGQKPHDTKAAMDNEAAAPTRAVKASGADASTDGGGFTRVSAE